MMDWIVSETDAYALLASFLQRKRGIAPLPEMARRAGGKPWFPDQPQVEFNVSHSGGLSLCALADGSVGADIERIRPRGAGLPRYTLSGQEWDWFCARGSRWEDFYTLWTLKEARVKCTGQGLRRPAREIGVPLLAPGEERDWQGFHFTALSGPGWRGAVCEAVSDTV